MKENRGFIKEKNGRIQISTAAIRLFGEEKHGLPDEKPLFEEAPHCLPSQKTVVELKTGLFKIVEEAVCL